VNLFKFLEKSDLAKLESWGYPPPVNCMMLACIILITYWCMTYWWTFKTHANNVY